jgi:hypothetical protein
MPVNPVVMPVVTPAVVPAAAPPPVMALAMPARIPGSARRGKHMLESPLKTPERELADAVGFTGDESATNTLEPTLGYSVAIVDIVEK